MLDALVEEAVRDHGLDLAAGLQVVAAERLTSTPIEPSRPLLIVPLALLGGAMAAPSAALPGRHGPNGRDPLVLLRRLYPAAATVAPLGRGGRMSRQRKTAALVAFRGDGEALQGGDEKTATPVLRPDFC